ncbi:hypothetical protein HOU02_gp314 [Caulobacter phage CcrBL9]|uniref:Uncharacterized protein n=1 Tax=Caulobacter phage CcrBL9 TaxID=2283270 RepID=A0A385EC01_9CAUD|nr:hypothetical protein HOU02_gp314 [Caulobacter phage CcrBL9]AXQ69411.1 hypothetical protein CcrBL9_gp387 [Caulobacter phage CcrBL9]
MIAAWSPPADVRARNQIIGIYDFSPRSNARPVYAICLDMADHLFVKDIFEGRQDWCFDQLEMLQERYPGRGFAFHPLPRDLQVQVDEWARHRGVTIWTKGTRDPKHHAHLGVIQHAIERGAIRLRPDLMIENAAYLEALFYPWQWYHRPPIAVNYLVQ